MASIEELIRQWWERLSEDRHRVLAAAARENRMDAETAQLLTKTRCPFGPVSANWVAQPGAEVMMTWPGNVRDFIRGVTMTLPVAGSVHNTTAGGLYQLATPFLMREWGQGDDDWVEVAHAGPGKLRPQDGALMPNMVTVTLADGDTRFFNFDDHFEVGMKPEGG